MLDKEVHPPRKIDLVVFKVFYYVLHQNVTQLENLSHLHPLGPVISNLVVAHNLVEGIVESENNLH